MLRREFFDARLNQLREAHQVLGLIAQLYDIEDEIRLLSPDERLAARQQRSVPILDRLEPFLREQQADALPKSQFGKAIAYALNHWPELRRFTENGVLEIDNNISERTLRLWRSGEKTGCSWGATVGARRRRSVSASWPMPRRYRIEPFAYVRALLIALSSDEVDLESLLPDVWIAAHLEHVLTYRRDEAEAAANARRRRRATRARRPESPL